MLKAFITASILIATVALPAQAQKRPGLGRTDTIVNRGTYATVCTGSPYGRLSMRTGPSVGYRKIKEMPNGHTLALNGGQYGSDGYWWWRVAHNGNYGWARADYICGDPQ